MPITLKELADFCNARVEGGDSSVMVTAAADITSAQQGQVTQLTNHRYLRYLKDSKASACFIANDFVLNDADVPDTTALLRCVDPEMAFIDAVLLLHPAKVYDADIAPQAALGKNVTLANNVHIAPFAVIGDNVTIGEGSVVLAGAYVGNNVTIGKNCRIYPYAVIYDNSVIGNEVIIHSGAIIGADGFGYKFRNYRHIKVPQVGNVVIGDFVEIGANTCIDRGALGSTTVGTGSKIDNLVQVGHNNKIGQHVILCGLTGVSGSCTIEDYAILAGSAGVADHITIGQG
ncbi:partial UDP-3-O-[3-hydroxymyristoyl] glucosamine N-acyltransferase, partial [Patescibacteria group bacterium]